MYQNLASIVVPFFVQFASVWSWGLGGCDCGLMYFADVKHISVDHLRESVVYNEFMIHYITDESQVTLQIFNSIIRPE